MNLKSSIRSPRCWGVVNASAFSLIECLAYMAIFFVVLGLALAAYYQMDEQSRGFTRNSADIVRALQAGERWRADMRSATNAARFDVDQELRLTGRSGDVSYYFRDGTVWRQGTNDAHARPMLPNVKASAMHLDARPSVPAWRWEIELQTKRTNVTIRPLFTFLAVPTSEVAK